MKEEAPQNTGNPYMHPYMHPYSQTLVPPTCGSQSEGVTMYSVHKSYHMIEVHM